MAYVKAKASTVVSKQVPEFIREENTKFVDFLKAYYEWLENFYPQSNLEDIKDIDNTVDFFIDYFKKEILAPIPQDIISNKRFLAKNIKNLYLSKGTENSYKFLFRILFNEDAEVYYPKIDMLRVSDGKWSQRNILRATSIIGDARNIVGQTITQTRNYQDGSVQIATARVENVTEFDYLGTTISELTLSEDSITGVFYSQTDSESFTITSRSNIDNSVVSCNVLSIINDFNITSGGSYYTVGDLIGFISSTGALARAEVATILPGSVTNITIANRGTGYLIGDPILFNNTGTGGPENSPSLSAVANITEIDRDSLLLEGGGKILSESLGELDIETSNSGPIKKVTVINGGFFYNRLPKVSLPTGAGRTGGKVLAESNDIGTISSIVVPESGFNYINPPNLQIPTYAVIKNPSGNFIVGESIVSLPQKLGLETSLDDNLLLESGDKFLSEKQQNASGILENINGDLHLIKLKESTSFGGYLLEDGSGYLLDEDEDIFVRQESGYFIKHMDIRGTVSNTTAVITSVNNPSIRASVGAVGKQIGGFSNTDGKISESSKRIQDSLYYQDYSYVIKVGQSINQYRDAVKKLLHPIGLALFGEVKLKSTATSRSSIHSSSINYTVRKIIDAKMRAVGNYRTAYEVYASANKEQITLYLTDFIVSHLNISISSSEFLPILNFPNLPINQIHLLDLRPEVIGFEQAKTIITRSKVTDKVLYRSNQTNLVERSSPAFDGSARRAGANLVDLERYKFTHKPSVFGTKYANIDGTPAYTTSTYGVINTYPNPNYNYWGIGNTQIKDFGSLTVSDVLNSPYRKVNFAIESEIGIIRLPASALRFSTDDARFTWDDTYTFDADSVEFDTTGYKWDVDTLKFDLYT